MRGFLFDSEKMYQEAYRTEDRQIKHPAHFMSGVPYNLWISSDYSGKLLKKQLCDLYCIGSSALSYLVTAAPEVDAVLSDKVSSDAAYIYDILVGCNDRHRIQLIISVIIELCSRSLIDSLAYCIKIKLLFSDYIYGDSM